MPVELQTSFLALYIQTNLNFMGIYLHAKSYWFAYYYETISLLLYLSTSILIAWIYFSKPSIVISLEDNLFWRDSIINLFNAYSSLWFTWNWSMN